jgi:hypothetical protein
MKRKVILVLALILIAGCGTKAALVTEPKLAGCYHGHVGDSDSVFNVNSQNEGKVKGSMSFVFAQKDSSYGTYEGTFKNKTLTATYTFWSEGIQSVDTRVFTKDGDNFVGLGYTYLPANDCEKFLTKVSA